MAGVAGVAGRWLLGLIVLVATAGAAGAAPAGPPAVPEAEGDAITIESDGPQTKKGDVLAAEGLVRIRYRDMLLQADRIELDQKTREAVATGDVLLQERDRRITGDRLEFNLDTRRGRIYGAWGYSDPDVFFAAETIEKKDEETYRLSGGTVTACNQPLPQWRLRASSGTYVVDKHVRLWNARLEVFGVPLVYVPFLQYPVKRDRSTGFLFPLVGTSDTRGFNLTNAFFWAIGRSYDATFSDEYYADRGHTVRTEFRYAPSRRLAGTFTSENRFDTLDDTVRSQYRYNHNQRLGRTWQLGADIHYASDEDIDRDFSHSFSRITRRTRRSSAFLNRNWSRYSLGVSGQHEVVANEAVDQSQSTLPSVAFAIRDLPVLGPLHVSVASRGDRFQRPIFNLDETWERLDAEPALRAALNPFPWLKVTPEGRYRLTYYTRSFAPGSGRQALTDDTFLRRYGSFGLDVIGPIFGRVFHTPGGGYSDKYKHVIEPAISYDYTDDIDLQAQAILFDGVDRARSQNQLNATLRNRVFARRAPPGSDRVAPYEFLTFDLTTSYLLDRDLENRGVNVDRLLPINGRLRFNPGPEMGVDYRFSFDPQDALFTQHTVGANWRRPGFTAEATFTRTASVDRVSSSALRGRTGLSLFGNRLGLGGSVSYDILGEDVPELTGSAVWRTQCCGFGVGYQRYSRGGGLQENTLNFSVSLRHVGTIFDYSLGDGRL